MGLDSPLWGHIGNEGEHIDAGVGVEGDLDVEDE